VRPRPHTHTEHEPRSPPSPTPPKHGAVGQPYWEEMPSQGVVFGKKTSQHPGLSPVEGQKSGPIAKGPQQGGPPPGSLHRSPMERDTPPLEPLTTTSQSPRQMGPLRVAHSAPPEPPQERCSSPESFYQPLRVPSKGALPSQKSPLYEPSSRFPNRSPY
jgi:hypothetical protein